MQIFQKISFHIGFYIIHNETIYICWINLTFLFIIIFFQCNFDIFTILQYMS